MSPPDQNSALIGTHRLLDLLNDLVTEWAVM